MPFSPVSSFRAKTKNFPWETLLLRYFPSPALNPSPLYAKIELSLISLLIKSIAGIDFSQKGLMFHEAREKSLHTTGICQPLSHR